MPIPQIELREVEKIHSPFSGQPADTEDGPNEGDPTLLFVCYSGSVWAYTSPRIEDQLVNDGHDLDPDEVIETLAVENALVFTVRDNWNGDRYYGFAPTQE